MTGGAGGAADLASAGIATTVLRSERKSIALVITDDGNLLVRAPLRLPAREIESLIREKNAWIRRKAAEVRKRPAPHPRKGVQGEEYLFLGKTLRLAIPGGGETPGKEKIRRAGEWLYVPESMLPPSGHLEQWYRERAREVIAARVAHFGKMTGCNPVPVRITGARRRWGSCSSAGSLNFSWRLVMAPQDIVDYVVVHELMHIGTPDHSKKFWAKVAAVIPDYRERRAWLRENGRALTL